MSYASTRWLLLLGLGHLSNKNKFTIGYKHCYNANRIQISSVHYTCLPRDSLESVTAYAVNVVPTSGTRVSSMPWRNGSSPPLCHSSQILSIYLLSVHYLSITWLRIVDRQVAYKTDYIFILDCLAIMSLCKCPEVYRNTPRSKHSRNVRGRNESITSLRDYGCEMRKGSEVDRPWSPGICL